MQMIIKLFFEKKKKWQERFIGIEVLVRIYLLVNPLFSSHHFKDINFVFLECLNCLTV